MTDKPGPGGSEKVVEAALQVTEQNVDGRLMQCYGYQLSKKAKRTCIVVAPALGGRS